MVVASEPVRAPLKPRADHKHPALRSRGEQPSELVSRPTSRLAGYQDAADTTTEVQELAALQRRATSAALAPATADFQHHAPDREQEEGDRLQPERSPGSVKSHASDGMETGLAGEATSPWRSPGDTVHQLRRAAFSAALWPAVQPFNAANRPDHLTALRGSSILTQRKSVDVLQRDEDGDGVSWGALGKFLGDVRKYGAFAAGSKLVGMTFASLTALALAIETAIWGINNYFGEGPAGENTIIPAIIGFAAQLSYFMKNARVAYRSIDLVSRKKARLRHLAQSYKTALLNHLHNDADLAIASDIRDEGQRVYAELVEVMKTEKAGIASIISSGAGLLLAYAAVFAFPLEHDSWRTSFGPDFSTLLALLTVFAPLVQKAVDGWAGRSSALPPNPFEASISSARAALNPPAPLPDSDDSSSGGASSSDMNYESFSSDNGGSGSEGASENGSESDLENASSASGSYHSALGVGSDDQSASESGASLRSSSGSEGSYASAMGSESSSDASPEPKSWSWQVVGGALSYVSSYFTSPASEPVEDSPV
ncbi:hypothetical protein [uncultured Roseobacter sp.]|uniref:hypothetical protein n=1 Tax=uncultured Roseobacter sp. TaxID=114847 RepID=UPI00262E325F|nr:hypothetical protein [uncultured Roseobacter sp.]